MQIGTCPSVNLRLLTSPNDPLFWDALELYVETFPREERTPLSDIAALAFDPYSNGKTPDSLQRLAIAEVDGVLAGVRIFATNSAFGLGFNIYLVVAPAHRNCGIGRKLVKFGIEKMKAHLNRTSA